MYVRLRPDSGRLLDLCLVGVIVLGTLLLAVRIIDFGCPPFEDAAMLMRYAEHVAQGDGLVWNVGEKPLDGATDFLFVLLAAALNRVGFSVENAVRLLDFICHVALVAVVYFGAKRAGGGRRAPAAFAALLMAAGPGYLLVAAYFGTPLFALLAAVTWVLAGLCSERPEDRGRAGAFSAAALLLGLARPEGVIIAALAALSVPLRGGFRKSIRFLLTFVAVYAVLGGAYFAWRWSYFGYPLPNPFYKKGGGKLYWDSFLISWNNGWVFLRPVIWAAPFAFLAKGGARRFAAAVLVVGGFLSAWVLLSSEMNHFMRFQYPILPVILIEFAAVLRGAADAPHPWLDRTAPRLRAATVCAAAVLLLAPAVQDYRHAVTAKVPHRTAATRSLCGCGTAMRAA